MVPILELKTQLGNPKYGTTARIGSKVQDISGLHFGRWTVLRFLGREGTTSYWLCRCECGIETRVGARNLKNGTSTSCGCWMREKAAARNRTHGYAGRPEYQAWEGLIARCTRVKHKSYANYGGRGITVCERWRKFENFIVDVGPRPISKRTPYTLERVDNSKGYEPGNVIWAIYKKQARNRRNNHLVTYSGETRCLAEFIEILGLDGERVRSRLKRGWTIEAAFEAGLQVRQKAFLNANSKEKGSEEPAESKEQG